MLLRHLPMIGLILLFALGQTAALVHPLSHATEASGQSSTVANSDESRTNRDPSGSTPNTKAHTSICEKCLAYSHLAHALNKLPLQPPVLSIAVSTTWQSIHAFTPALHTAFAARAPPAPIASHLF